MQDIREDDAEHLINVISYLRGVQSVVPITNSSEDWIIRRRTKDELRKKLMELVEDLNE